MTGCPSIVETYLADLRRIRASGGATGERSGYGPLANLLNEIGGGLKSRVFYIGELVDQGACRPAVRSDRDQASRCVPAGLPVVGRGREAGTIGRCVSSSSSGGVPTAGTGWRGGYACRACRTSDERAGGRTGGRSSEAGWCDCVEDCKPDRNERCELSS